MPPWLYWPQQRASILGNTTVLTDTLARIEALKAELESLRPLKPEYEQRLWQKLRLEWNYNSNHIEGNTLTYGETYLLLIHDKTNGGHTMREFEEMKAHDLAVSKVAEWSADSERSLTEADVRDLNKILLKEPFWKEAITPDGQPTRVQIFPGEYKRQPNNVRLQNGEIFHFASVEETPARMRELMGWFADTVDLHPIEKAAKFHHDFVLIHPFGDGNGRAARLVVNYILMSAGYMPLVIKSADKTNYLNALQLADAGDLLPLTEYLAKQEEWALELGVRAAQGESVEEASDWEKRANILFRQADSELQSDKQREANWRATVSRWLDLNFDEFQAQVRSKVLVFDRFYSANSFTCMIHAKRLAGTYQPAFAKIDKAAMLDLWDNKGMSTFIVHLHFKKYKFKGVVKDKNFMFSLNFEPEQIRFHWYKPEKTDEFVGYGQLLVDRSLVGLDRAAEWIYEDIERAQE